jgi:hypothetical protein
MTFWKAFSTWLLIAHAIMFRQKRGDWYRHRPRCPFFSKKSIPVWNYFMHEQFYGWKNIPNKDFWHWKYFLLLQNFQIFATAPYLITFIDWRCSQSCWYCRPSLTNCCPSNLLSGSTLPLPPLPSPVPYLNKYIVHTYTVCKGRVWGSGPQTDKHLPQSPLQVNYLDDDILHFLLWVLSFYGIQYVAVTDLLYIGDFI